MIAPARVVVGLAVVGSMDGLYGLLDGAWALPEAGLGPVAATVPAGQQAGLPARHLPRERDLGRRAGLRRRVPPVVRTRTWNGPAAGAYVAQKLAQKRR